MFPKYAMLTVNKKNSKLFIIENGETFSLSNNHVIASVRRCRVFKSCISNVWLANHWSWSFKGEIIRPWSAANFFVHL